jgi:acyl carrier protein
MDVTDRLKRILRDALQLGERAGRLTRESGLLGNIAEFDSMAVVTVLTMIEDEFGFAVADDEVSADTFRTLGTLADFVSWKQSH